jgi:DNA-binding SARP family transcriptional activator/tetratricopeptide (TPR) repeat protein
VEFRVLGPIEFWATGIRKDLGTAKERLLLAILLLAEGRPIPAETLIDRVWGENPPAEVRQSLQTDMSRLRRRFKTYGVAEEVRLVATPGAYALEVAPQHVDVFRSRELREQATSSRENGNTRTAVKLLREAVDLWRAEPLTGISGEWVDQMRASLDGDYRAMAHELAKIELATGNHAQIIGFLVDLIARYPLDEFFVGHLMIAYYWCGRQADAIALYRETARRLHVDTGTAPSPRLQTLHRNIRRHDPSVAAPRRSPGEAIPGLNRLPSPIPDFTGRSAELAALSGELGGVVTIEGMPSVGKTTLAIKVAHELAGHFPDGCILLNLHGHDAQLAPETSAAALSKLLQAVGITPPAIPQEQADRARMWRGAIEGRRILLVLDDAANGDQVLPLLPGNPDCHVIITSRRHLTGIEGARHHRLGVLPAADAVALFTRIAGPDVTNPPDALTDAVGGCGGLPLAIRFAATRLRDRRVPSIETLAEELRGPHEDIADLQDPALARTFALSYRSLPPTQRRVFRRLGLSPAPELTAPAVAILTDTSLDEARQSLADFVDHYLLEETSPGRFQLHDLIRQYALACSNREDSASDRRRAIGRTLDFYLLRADAADRALFPHHARTDVGASDGSAPVFADEGAAREWLVAERGNLSRLFQYAAGHVRNAHAIDYAKVMARYLDSVSQWEEAEAIHRRALNIALELQRPRAIAEAYFNLSVVQCRLGQMDQAFFNATKAKHISHRLRDGALEAAAQDQVGLVAFSSSNYREALAYFGETLDLYGEIGDTRGKAECLNHVGMTLAQTGRHSEALNSFHDALDICQAIGDVRGEAITLSNLAHTYLLLGYHRDAYELYQKSHDIYRTLTGRRNNAILKNNLGDVARYRGRYETALKHYGEALAEFSATGDRINEPNALNNIGLTLSGMEQYGEALIRHQAAMEISKMINNTGEKIRAMLGIADVNVGTGQYPAAAENYRAARRLARQISDPYLEAQALSGIAHVTSLTKGHDAARIFWRQAYDLFTQLNIVPEIEAVRIRLEITGLADS